MSEISNGQKLTIVHKELKTLVVIYLRVVNMNFIMYLHYCFKF